MNIPLTSSYAGGGGIELSMTGGGAPSILWRSDTICKLNNAESGYQNHIFLGHVQVSLSYMI
jgi:hypothetical protein